MFRAMESDGGSEAFEKIIEKNNQHIAGMNWRHNDTNDEDVEPVPSSPSVATTHNETCSSEGVQAPFNR